MAHWSRIWIKPEVYPLFAAIGTAVGLCGFALSRKVFQDPNQRWWKPDRLEGIIDNYDQGERYKHHALRRYLADKKPEIMPVLNQYMSGNHGSKPTTA